jgi:site-specific recombinase XerD
MKLKMLALNYIAYRKAMGEKFLSNESRLKAFCKHIGDDIDIECVSTDKVTEFLYGKGPITSSWFIKHSVLVGFYEFAISRGYLNFSPMPAILPKRPSAFVPYIYTRKELRQLFDVAFTYQKKQNYVKPYMINRILLVLYGTGLRLSEALSLTMADVDLHQAIITVNQTKFFKSRLVPFGSQLAGVISEFIEWRKRQGLPQEADDPFFYGRDGKPLNRRVLQRGFRLICKKAGIQRSGGEGEQPRLHDLRHTFAVHRLMSWYQENANVQHLLFVLSVYMGHSSLAATSVYLTMTNDLLQEAGRRFEKYARYNSDGY